MNHNKTPLPELAAALIKAHDRVASLSRETAKAEDDFRRLCDHFAMHYGTLQKDGNLIRKGIDLIVCGDRLLQHVPGGFGFSMHIMRANIVAIGSPLALEHKE